MRIDDILRQSVRPLAVYKLRTTLSLLGILIGVAAVITLSTLMQSASHSVIGRVENLGTNLVIVTMNPLMRASSGIHDLSLRQAEDLGQLPRFSLASPVDYETTSIRWGRAQAGVTVYGASPTLTTILRYRIARGHALTPRDLVWHRRVALLGAQTSRELFGGKNPVGKSVTLNGQAYQVLGILAPKGAFLNINQDAVAIVPITTYQQQSHIRAVDSVYLRARGASVSRADIRVLNRQLSHMLGSANRYTVMTQSAILGVTHKITRLLTQVLAGVAAISILVGGIGMLNVLFISVSERIREIGVRKSLGARRIDILWQFLTEAVFIALLGGLFGAVLGIVASWLLARDLHVAMVLKPEIPALGLVASVILGVLFGIVPALRAAGLAPAQALRSD